MPAQQQFSNKPYAHRSLFINGQVVPCPSPCHQVSASYPPLHRSAVCHFTNHPLLSPVPVLLRSLQVRLGPGDPPVLIEYNRRSLRRDEGETEELCLSPVIIYQDKNSPHMRRPQHVSSGRVRHHCSCSPVRNRCNMFGMI